MTLFRYLDQEPEIADSAYVSPTAQVIGNVVIGERCYIGHGAILRGDYGRIEIGDESAVEEGVIVHSRPDDKTVLGKRVTVGHGAMIHNATIKDGAVIGMRAVVSDFSEVGEGAVIGEMGLVRRHQKVPARMIALGVPVKIVKEVEEKHGDMTHWAKDLYVELAATYKAGAMQEIKKG